MNKSNKSLILLMLFCAFFLPAPQAKAVMPPDFIYNIGSQVLQFFSVIAVFVSAFFGIAYRCICMRFAAAKPNKYFLAGIVLFALSVSFAAAYLYDIHRQKTEYDEWLAESRMNEMPGDRKVGSGGKETMDGEASKRLQADAAQGSSTAVEGILSLKRTEEPATGSPLGIIGDEENDFYEKHKSDGLAVKNEDFAKAVKEGGDYLVLDAREDIEYENGRFPGSTHIRFADLGSRLGELPRDRRIYVICWSGIRGKEVTEYLRSKAISAQYLEKGAKGWYDYGGKWEGNIMFAEKYSDKSFSLVFTTKETKSLASKGAFLIDCREPAKYKTKHIKGSVNIPIMYTPTAELDKAFGQVPKGKEVVTVCDAYVNCFDAKITGVELTKRGYRFLGRYNKPWDYK